MRKQPLNTKGFAPLVLLIAVAAVLVVGGGGVYVYHQNHKAKPTAVSNNTSSTKTSTQTSKSSTTSGTSAATTQGTYLDLTQEGVKFLLSSSVSDATYAPYVSPISGGTAYGLSTQKLENSGAAGDCTAEYGPLGTISVGTTAPDQVGTQTPMTPDNKTMFLIAGKYYYYEPPQDPAMCSAFTDAVTQTYQQAIAQSFASLQADN
jgi:cytoskeletal protein RodZ